MGLPLLHNRYIGSGIHIEQCYFAGRMRCHYLGFRSTGDQVGKLIVIRLESRVIAFILTGLRSGSTSLVKGTGLKDLWFELSEVSQTVGSPTRYTPLSNRASRTIPKSTRQLTTLSSYPYRDSPPTESATPRT